jgi:hypothetical protein
VVIDDKQICVRQARRGLDHRPTSVMMAEIGLDPHGKWRNLKLEALSKEPLSFHYVSQRLFCRRSFRNAVCSLKAAIALRIDQRRTQLSLRYDEPFTLLLISRLCKNKFNLKSTSPESLTSGSPWVRVVTLFSACVDIRQHCHAYEKRGFLADLCALVFVVRPLLALRYVLGGSYGIMLATHVSIPTTLAYAFFGQDGSSLVGPESKGLEAFSQQLRHLP